MNLFNALIDKVKLRKRAYAAIPHDVRVDLARFCCAHKSCFHADPRRHALMEGRREVWLWLEMHWQMTPAQLAEIYYAAASAAGSTETVND